jgi:uncharacterized membrane protein YkvA (DUF1232 family)
MKDLVRLFRAWLGRRYWVVPWRTIVILVATVLYAITPIDLIPDYIPFICVVGGLAMLGFPWQLLSRDVKRFLEWEKAGGTVL